MMHFSQTFLSKYKSGIALGLVIFTFSCSHSQNMDQDKSSRIELLVEYYEKANKDERKYGRLFFDVFPDNFSEFNKLYGYNDDTNMPLTEYAVEHIAQFFFTLDGVADKEDYMNKVISIAIGGKWYSDGVNYFQRGLREKVKSNLPYTVKRLSKLPNDEIKGFWYFYFDGPHPKEFIPEELKQVKSLDSNVYSLMIEAHRQVLMDRKVH